MEYKVLSLFSGGMGLDIGVEETGQFVLLACVKKIPAFTQTIKRNRYSGLIRNPGLKIYDAEVRHLEPAKGTKRVKGEVYTHLAG